MVVQTTCLSLLLARKTLVLPLTADGGRIVVGIGAHGPWINGRITSPFFQDLFGNKEIRLMLVLLSFDSSSLYHGYCFL
jgi:hypothetical protein